MLVLFSINFMKLFILKNISFWRIISLMLEVHEEIWKKTAINTGESVFLQYLSQLTLLKSIIKPMLGLESQISVKEENTVFSDHLAMETKISQSTKHLSRVQPSSDLTQPQSSAKLQKTDKLKTMRHKIKQMEQKQLEVEEKLSNYLSIMERELKKKEEHNRQLEDQIRTLKKEIEESKTDVDVLGAYIQKKKLGQSGIEQSQKVSSPYKHKMTLLSKGKSRSPVHREDQKSPSHSRNRNFMK